MKRVLLALLLVLFAIQVIRIIGIGSRLAYLATLRWYYMRKWRAAVADPDNARAAQHALFLRLLAMRIVLARELHDLADEQSPEDA